MPESNEIFRHRLALRLQGHGAVADFCRKTGLSRSAVDLWLSGDRSPTLKNLDLAASALDVRPWDLIMPEGAQPEARPSQIESLLRKLLAIQEEDPGFLQDISMAIDQMRGTHAQRIRPKATKK